MVSESAVRQAAREAAEVIGAIRAEEGFEILEFGRHADGYFHAKVSKGGRAVYVFAKYGSWMAPGQVKGEPVLKEVLAPYKFVLAERARDARAAEARVERRDAEEREAARIAAELQAKVE